MQRKIEVGDLRLGMYVVELDRPWLQSPFLFQGFPIQSNAELQQLQACCAYVYVDESRVDPSPVRAASPALATDQHAQPQAAASAAASVSQLDHHALRLAMRQSYKTRQIARRQLREVMQDVRLGGSISTESARATVTELVESVAHNVSASLWLTNLKNKDEYTSIHSLNVCVLSVAFAYHLGLPRERIEVIGLGALLHDIGKMRTPEALLNKPGKLSDEEFEVIRRHPLDGYEIVAGAGGVPPEALEIIRHHHERLDGRGYPDGLEGDQIGQHVLITAIADVYDAVTSDRAYHRGIPPHEGLKVLFRMADGGFGRELVEEFVRCIGIYPVGSLVRLGNGILGVVVASSRERRLQPVVSLLRSADGLPILPRRLVDLAWQAERDQSEHWRIAEVLDPAAAGVDMAALTLAEAAG